jgi:hypothetical protein
LQIGKFGVACNPAISVGIDQSAFSNTSIINGWGNSSNPGINVGTTRTDGTAFSVVTGATLDANFIPATSGNIAFTVLGSGNVGIGTGSPTVGALQIAAPDQATISALAIRQSNAPGYGFDFALDQLVDGKGYLYGISANSRTNLMQLDRSNNTISFPAGKISIGTSDAKGYQLAVNGSAIATSMTVKLYANWPDYVFKKDYKLPSLLEVKTYIDRNQHLPDMPSGQQVAEDGINLGEIVKLQMQKIEELTLYLIDQQKEMEQLKRQVSTLTKAVTKN